MTGPVGRPLRAGSSVNDIMGAIGMLAALNERNRTGVGKEVQSALYENCVLLMTLGMLLVMLFPQIALGLPESMINAQ